MRRTPEPIPDAGPLLHDLGVAFGGSLTVSPASTRTSGRQHPMSGVCGIYSPSDPSQATSAHLDGILGAIAHRGTAPRSFVDEQLGIAIGRVRSPSESAHPDFSGWHDDEDAVVSVDGVPFGVADPVAAAVRSGAASFGRCSGHFAVALWNRTNRELSILRDPLETKPLYYWHSGSVIVFASELKGILAHPAVERRIDQRGLSLCLTFGYVPAPRSMFEDVQKVFPGETVTVDERARLTSQSCWTMPGVEPSPAELSLLASDARERTLESCAKHVGDAKRVGVFLSGGVDSTILVGVLKLLGVPEIHTFTLGFRGSHTAPRMSEDLQWAERVAKRFGTMHHPVVIDVGDGAVDLEQTWRQFDEPILTPNAHSKQFLSQAARQHDVRLCVSALGAEHAFSSIYGKKLATAEQRIREGGSEIEALVRRYQRTFSFDEQQELLVEPLDDPRGLALDVMRRYNEDVEAQDVGDRMLVSATRLKLAERSVAVQDRTAAASGVQVVHPFRDPEVIAFSRTIPVSLKRGTSSRNPKSFLLRAFGDLVPDEIMTRQVIGYPTYYWNHGELDAWKRILLSQAAIRRAGMFNEKVVQRVIKSNAASTRKTARRQAWAVLTLQAWYAFHVSDDLPTDIGRRLEGHEGLS